MQTLESYIHHCLERQKNAGVNPILLMSHLVLGHPSLDENRLVIDQMVANGVEIMELQIPFSEPIADGPVIAHANQMALDQGFSVRSGLQFIAEITHRHAIPFLIMTYYNILLAYGVRDFIEQLAKIGVRGLIVPDLPLEIAEEPMQLCKENGLDWIQILTPTSGDRLKMLGKAASGFCYCVARKGVTGSKTDFGAELSDFIQTCRQVTHLPLAVGFGVQNQGDVNHLAKYAEIAVVGTASLRIYETEGADAVGKFFKNLRPV
ncbi:MAG: tryptophan synthase subunit alpha [Magnetococcus sp. DMHC-6]